MNPEEEYFIRELTRKLDEQINSIRRELDNLKKIGLLKSRVRNRKKYYYVNADFLLFGELRDMFAKAGGNSDQEIVKKISKMGDVQLMVLSGLFVKKESASVDLLIVGELDKKKLQAYLSKFHSKERDVKFTLITKEDFLYRLGCKDKFVYEIMKDKASVIAINKLKKEMTALSS